MRNMKKPIAALVTVFVVLCFFSACWSPWQGDAGDGTLTLNFGGTTGLSRVAVDPPAELAGMVFTVTLSGPGPTLTQTVSGSGTVSFLVNPGIWTVDVRAMGAPPFNYIDSITPPDPKAFPDRILRAIGSATVTVQPGANAAQIPLHTATEVHNDRQLTTAVDHARDDGKPEYILVAGDIAVNSLSVPPGTNIILASASGVKKITWPTTGVSPDPLISIPPNVSSPQLPSATLTLGDPDHPENTLVIDGSYAGTTDVLVAVADATLIMNGSTTITNGNSNGGVMIQGFSGNAVFTMNGGTISNNQTAGSGGGVFVEGSSGGSATFIMNGGTISDNQVTGTGNGGGGVAISGNGANAAFIMNGGTISDNQATGSGNGGGVHIGGNGAAFTMNGGTISGNKADGDGGGGLYIGEGTVIMSGGVIERNNSINSALAYGGGIYMDDGSFTMSGSALIRNNSATGSAANSQAEGGGVYLANGGAPSFTMNGGTITLNHAQSDSKSLGGGICNESTVSMILSSGNISDNTAEITGTTGMASGGGIWSTGTPSPPGVIVTGNHNLGNGALVNINNEPEYNW
ncbi:hypothetical protein AGMMS49928_13180 [Spirochaetia bacterium]|nr:hypothetical protein AGMMS49928_13180 [Spirochaetia bacterium]